MDYFSTAHTNMIKGQILPAGVTDAATVNAFATVDRHLFVPDSLKKLSYGDQHLALEHGRQLIAPASMALMIQAAHITKRDNVLDVGCLSGYSSALLAQLAHEVVAIESEKTFASNAHNMLCKLKIHNVIVLQNDLRAGHPETGPYQVIFVNGAMREIPDTLLNQLADQGRLIAVVKKHPHIGQAMMIQKQNNAYATKVLFDINLNYLPNL